MNIKCFDCHKRISSPIPDEVIFRGTATCPECEEIKYHDGFEVVYISDAFFNAIEKWLNAISRVSPNQIGGSPPIALRDAIAQIEFRRLSSKTAEC